MALKTPQAKAAREFGYETVSRWQQLRNDKLPFYYGGILQKHLEWGEK